MSHGLSTILKNGEKGICSICSAHPMVIEAALRFDLKSDRMVLIEATCNQVNQFGGYTGMKPADFREFVYKIAQKVGFPKERLWLGGDHLGPNPWTDLPAEKAMANAVEMIGDYVKAGFAKIHIDASMPLGGDSVPLAADIVAERAAQLCQAAEAAISVSKPLYVIGTEVPTPGGETEGLDSISVTKPARLAETVETHKKAFLKHGLDDAFKRVIAVVVQPGVDFSDQNIMQYDPAKARELVAALKAYPALVFEAHSTDYQKPESFKALVKDHFAILKVGPALTFALREGLFGLAAIENELVEPQSRSQLRNVIETVMKENPKYWHSYYRGDETQKSWLRGFSFSDRIRYYWGNEQISNAVTRLLENLEKKELPIPLLSQYFGKELERSHTNNTALSLLNDKVFQVLEAYRYGCQG